MAIILDNTRLSPKVQKIVTKPKTSLATIATALKPSSFSAKSKTVTPTKTNVTKIPYNLQGAVLPKNQITNPTLSTKTTQVNKVTIASTPARDLAIKTLSESKMGEALRNAPNFQKVFTTIRTKQTAAAISNAGMELAPKGTTAAVYTAQDQALIASSGYLTLQGINEQLVARQTEYQSQIAQTQQTLAQQAIDYSVTQGKLSNLEGQYSTLMQKYQDLLNKPPEPGIPDIFGGLGDFINKYGLWIALGVGAIILLPSILSITRKG